MATNSGDDLVNFPDVKHTSKSPLLASSSFGSEGTGIEQTESVVQQKEMKDRQRWGKVIDMKSYTPGPFIRLVALVIGILLVPLQLFCDGLIKEKERGLILNLQENGFLGSCQDHDSVCTRIMMIFHGSFDSEPVVFMLFALLLVADSWLAYKTTLVTCMGIYWVTFLQLFFKSGRPFWDEADITSNGHCFFDFAGPALIGFNMTFFWPYVQIMFFAKYYQSPSLWLNLLLLGILLACWVNVYLFGLINGLNYIYQTVLGQLVGFCYLVGCLVFDTEVHRYCQKTGFNMRSSRARKFYLFFFLLGLFVMIMVYFYSLESIWNMPQNWIVNANFKEASCLNDFQESANNNLGLNQTFNISSVLFVILGMIFGWPYALHYFSALQWRNTSLWKKLVRTVLGVGVAVGVQFAFQWAVNGTNDIATKYFFGAAVPYFCNSFFIFGLFPVLCTKIGLVQKESNFVEQYPELRKLSASMMMSSNERRPFVATQPPKDPSMLKQNQLLTSKQQEANEQLLLRSDSESEMLGLDANHKSAFFGQNSYKSGKKEVVETGLGGASGNVNRVSRSRSESGEVGSPTSKSPQDKQFHLDIKDVDE